MQTNMHEVVRIEKSIKTLILEIMGGNGPSHIKEVHLQVVEFRPDVPQHTVRARLSELSHTDNLEERLKAFGNGFYGPYEENKDMCSVVSYPDRGPWGDAKYRGNCSGHFVKDLILRFGCQSVFDPSEGGGTVRDVVAGINQHLKKDIEYEGRDLHHGWNLMTSPLPDKQYDLVWYHPPYWNIIRYSENRFDLSNAGSLDEFEDMLNLCVERLSQVVKRGGIMAVLIGDKRKSGQYYPLFRTLLMNEKIGQLKAIIIKIQHHCKSDQTIYECRNPFMIPIKHEYCLVFQKG
jgi:hypothetical protein